MIYTFIINKLLFAMTQVTQPDFWSHSTASQERKECENKSETLNGCRCCFTPDRMFETAVESILALGINEIDAGQAQKFVRLCMADSRGTMQLSKNKRCIRIHEIQCYRSPRTIRSITIRTWSIFLIGCENDLICFDFCGCYVQKGCI